MACRSGASNSAAMVLLVSVAAAGGCFSPDELGDEPETDASSTTGRTDPTTEAPSSSSQSTEPSGPTSTPTTGPSSSTSDDTSPPSTDDPDTDTGPGTDTEGEVVACGDGASVASELCLDVTAQSYSTDALPSDVAVADITANGLVDIVVITHGATSEDARLLVLEADGVGGFVPGMGGSAPSRPARLRIADADNDGDNDIFAAGGGLTYFRNQTSFFSVTQISTISGSTWRVQDLALADIDGDDIVDVLATDAYDQLVLPGTIAGNGNWEVGTSYSLPVPGEGASGLAAGVFSFDIDDGIDVAAFNQYSASATIVFGDDDGTLDAFGAVQMCPGNVNGIRYGEPGDFNGDGNTDFVVSCTGGDLSLVWGDEKGITTNLLALPLAGAFRVFPSDLDADGDLDILATSDTLNRAVMFINQGNAAFELSDTQFQSSGPVYSAAPADLNEDGAMDVVIAAENGDEGIVDVYFAEP